METLICCLCGAAFSEEPAAISGMRAPDELECPPCFEQSEADADELEADVAYALEGRP